MALGKNLSKQEPKAKPHNKHPNQTKSAIYKSKLIFYKTV